MLVNELYLELVTIRALQGAAPDEAEREAFLKLSAHLMRRLLIQHARPLTKRVVKEPIEDEIPQQGHESLPPREDRPAIADRRRNVRVRGFHCRVKSQSEWPALSERWHDAGRLLVIGLHRKWRLERHCDPRPVARGLGVFEEATDLPASQRTSSLDLVSGDGRIASESAFPQFVADDDRIAAIKVLLGTE